MDFCTSALIVMHIIVLIHCISPLPSSGPLLVPCWHFSAQDYGKEIRRMTREVNKERDEVDKNRKNEYRRGMHKLCS